MANIEVDIKKLKKAEQQYNKLNKPNKPNYEKTRAKLCKMVDRYGFEAIAIATGLNEATVKQHYRNATGTSMISLLRLEKAEGVFKLYDAGE